MKLLLQYTYLLAFSVEPACKAATCAGFCLTYPLFYPESKISVNTVAQDFL